MIEIGLAACFLLVFSTLSFGAEGPQGVGSQESYKMVTDSPADTFIIDVRTRAEYEFVGHPSLPNGVPNIPYKFYPLWKLNVYFVDKVEERYKKDDTLIIICRSGIRAEAAARLLLKAGFKSVLFMTDSFEGPKDKYGFRSISGWKVSGLPYTYELKDELIYKK